MVNVRGADVWIASLLSGRRQIYVLEQRMLAGGVNWLLLKPVIFLLHAAGAVPALRVLSEEDINESWRAETGYAIPLSLLQAHHLHMFEIP